MQHRALSLFKMGNKQNLLDPWYSTNRGTCGNGEYSNPQQLAEKGGFYGRGKWDKVDAHRIDTYDSIYVPTTHMPEVAAKFSFYGWVHHMLEPAIFVSIFRVHPYLPSLCDAVLEDRIYKEGELSGIHHIPWSDVSFSRKTLCPFSSPIPCYIGEPVVNPGFECRNYSMEILSANPVEAKEIYYLMEIRDSDSYKENERPLTLEEAEEINLALKETSKIYAVDKHSPFFRGLYTVSKQASKNQIIDARCKEYMALMDENEVERKVVMMRA